MTKEVVGVFVISGFPESSLDSSCTEINVLTSIRMAMTQIYVGPTRKRWNHSGALDSPFVGPILPFVVSCLIQYPSPPLQIRRTVGKQILPTSY